MSEKIEGQPEKKGPRRREFLKGLTAGAWAVGGGLTVGAGEAVYKRRKEILTALLDPHHQRDEDIRNAQDFIESQYGLRIRFDADFADDRYVGANLNAFDTRSALASFTVALMKYPREFFKHNPLPPIYIVGKLTDLSATKELGEKGYNVPPENAPERPNLGGFASQLSGEHIVLDYEGQMDSFEHTVHHELYHILDYRDNGYAQEDEEWSRRRREAGFGEYERSTSSTEQVDLPAANNYGQTNPREDRASIAEQLLSPWGHGWLMYRIETMENKNARKLLEDNVALIKAQYKLWSHGVMDESFWHRMEGVSAPYDYSQYEPSYGSVEPIIIRARRIRENPYGIVLGEGREEEEWFLAQNIMEWYGDEGGYSTSR